MKKTKQPLSLSVVSLILTVISIVLSVVFGYHSCKVEPKQELSYYYDEYRVIDKKEVTNPDLVISYKGEEISSYTATSIVFENTGTEEIRKEDIPSTSPITIKTTDSNKLLKVEVANQSNENSNYSISRFSTEECVFDFDYLNSGDYVWINIIHTGDFDDLSITGAIKGGSFPTTGKQLFSDKKQILLHVSIAMLFFITLLTVYLCNVIMKMAEDNKSKALLIRCFVIEMLSVGCLSFITTMAIRME